MEEMVKVLATLPEPQREAMMTSRMQMFAAASEEERRKGMAAMVRAVHQLPETERRTLILTRTKVFASLSAEPQERIVRSRAAIAGELPADVQRSDMELTMEAMAQLPPVLQAALRATMARAGFTSR